jgi:hypothetical protein
MMLECLERAMTLELEQCHDQLAVGGVVINDQYFCHSQQLARQWWPPRQ